MGLIFQERILFPPCNDTGSGTHPALWSTVRCVSLGGVYFPAIKRLGRELFVDLYLYHSALSQWRGAETQRQISVGGAGLNYLTFRHHASYI
jgi:hypothetical protein